MPAIAAIAARQINVVSAIVSIYSLLLHSMAKVRFFLNSPNVFWNFFLRDSNHGGNHGGVEKRSGQKLLQLSGQKLL